MSEHNDQTSHSTVSGWGVEYDEVKTYRVAYVDELEATATRLRELLRRVLYLHSDFQGVPSYTLDVLLKDIEKELELDKQTRNVVQEVTA